MDLPDCASTCFTNASRIGLPLVFVLPLAAAAFASASLSHSDCSTSVLSTKSFASDADRLGRDVTGRLSPTTTGSWSETRNSSGA